MSKVYVAGDYGFVGWNGRSVALNAGDEYDTADQIVQDMPERFTARAPEGVEAEQPKRRGRRG
jgi:hypothetical protein